MAKPYRNLRAQLSPDAQQQAEEKARALLAKDTRPPDHLRLFLLDGHTVVPCDSLAQWQAGMRDAVWEVACTTLEDQTVFTRFVGSLALHHPGQPLWLFQTCHANGRARTVTVIERYTTWEDAERGQARVVAALQDSLDLKRETRPPDISV